MLNNTELGSIVAGKHHWWVEKVYLEGCWTAHHGNAQAVTIDLAREIEKRESVRITKYSPAEEDNKFYLLPKYQGSSPSTINRVKNFLNNSLRPSQCVVILTSAKVSGSTPTVRRYYFGCPRCLTAEVKQQRGIRSTKTHRPLTNEEKCCFRISVHLEIADPITKTPIDNGRWFIRLDAGHILKHDFHVPGLMRPLRQSRRDIAPAFMKLLKTIFGHGLAPSTGHDLLEGLTNNKYDKKVIANIHNDIEYKEIGSNKRSAGQQMIDFLEQKEDVELVYYTATPQQGGELLRLRKRRKGKRAEDMDEKFHSEQLKALVNGMALEDGKEVLIAVAWVSHLQQRLFQLYSEYFAMDCTFGTNAEKRGLFRLILRSNSNKNIPLLCAFLPSLCEWVFNWIFADVMPTLFGKDVLKQVRMLTTDEDKFCIGAFQSIKPSLYPQCEIRLCKWHKVNRNFTTKVSRHSDSRADTRFISFVRDWLYSFTDSIETEEEERDSLAALKVFVNTANERGVSQRVATSTFKYLIESFIKSLPHLSFRHFMHLPNGDRADNCAIESEFSSLKRNRKGPKPHHPLNKSGKALVSRDGSYLGDILFRDNKEMSSSSQPRANETPQEQALRELSKNVVAFKATRAISQWNHGNQTNTYLASEEPMESVGVPCFQNGTPMFDNPPPEFQVFLVQENPSLVLPNRSAPRPKHRRIRTVVVVPAVAQDGCILVCSCALFQREGFPCRHIFKLIDRAPHMNDFHPSCMKIHTQMGIDSQEYFEAVKQASYLIGIYQGVPLCDSYPLKPPDHVVMAGHVTRASHPPFLRSGHASAPSKAVTPSPILKSPPKTAPSPQTLEDFLGNTRNLQAKMRQWFVPVVNEVLENCINKDICLQVNSMFNGVLQKSTRLAIEAGGNQGEGLIGFGSRDKRKKDYRHSTSSPSRKKKRQTASGKKKAKVQNNAKVIDLTMSFSSDDDSDEAKKCSPNKAAAKTPLSVKKPPTKEPLVSAKKPQLAHETLSSDDSLDMDDLLRPLSSDDSDDDNLLLPLAMKAKKFSPKKTPPAKQPSVKKPPAHCDYYLSESEEDPELDELLAYDCGIPKKLETPAQVLAKARWFQFTQEQKLRDELRDLREQQNQKPPTKLVFDTPEVARKPMIEPLPPTPKVSRKPVSDLDRLLFGESGYNDSPLHINKKQPAVPHCGTCRGTVPDKTGHNCAKCGVLLHAMCAHGEEGYGGHVHCYPCVGLPYDGMVWNTRDAKERSSM